MDEREVEAGLVDELARVIADAVGSRNVPWYRPAANAALQLALDRVRDARGDDEVQRLRAINAELVEAHNTLLVEAARSPQDEDHEAGIRVCPRGPHDDDAEKMDALGSYLEKYPPPGFADRYSADGWRHIAHGVLSAAAIFFGAPFPSPSRVGSVAVEDVERLIDARESMSVRQQRESWGSSATVVILDPSEWADLDSAIAALADLSRSSTVRPEQPEPDALGGQPPAEPDDGGDSENG
jgi:hypothetical protein